MTTATRTTTITILDLPTTICVNVFNYLDSDDFLTVSILAKRWYAERFIDHPGIRHDIVPTIELRPKNKSSSHSGKEDDGGNVDCAGGSAINFFLNLHFREKNPVTNDKLRNGYQHFRVIDLHKFDESICDKDFNKMIDTTTDDDSVTTTTTNYHLEPLDGIESLNLSVSSSVMRCGASRTLSTKICGDSLPYGLSRLLPNLLELNLSNGDYFGDILESFTKHCPLLEKIIWNNIRNTYIELDGYNIRYGRNLKELVLNDSTFAPTLHREISDLKKNSRTFMFQEITSFNKLERVSIQNAKIRDCLSRFVPQSALIKFVRNGPSSLKYFRSDLTQTNINILKQERPDIEFI